MSSFITGIARITKTLRSITPNAYGLLSSENRNCLLIPSCNYAARRGTRERKAKLHKKNKLLNELKRARLAPLYQRILANKLKREGKAVMKIPDSEKLPAVDNVYFADMFKLRVYSFQEAVLAHRETHHPTLYNFPNAPLNAFIELDLTTDKKTKFAQKITGIVPVRYKYKHTDNRSILAFCKLPEQIAEVRDAGVTLAGAEDIIKRIKKGKIVLPDFDFVIAHPNILSDLILIRGLLRKNFPSFENGMLTVNMVKLIENIKSGIRYTSDKNEIEPSYGWIDVRIGDLNMEMEHLEENFQLVLEDVKKKAPLRKKGVSNFITRVFLTSEPSLEKLKVSFEQYLKEEEKEEVSDDEEDTVEDLLYQQKQSKRRSKAAEDRATVSAAMAEAEKQDNVAADATEDNK